MRENDHYSPKSVVKGVLAIVAFALLCKYTQSLAYPVLVPFAVFYLVKRDYNGLYFIVLLAVSSIIFNSWFMPKPMVFAVTQRGILATLGCLLLPLAFWAMVFVGCALDAQRQMADRRLGAGAFPA